MLENFLYKLKYRQLHSYLDPHLFKSIDKNA